MVMCVVGVCGWCCVVCLSVGLCLEVQLYSGVPSKQSTHARGYVHHRGYICADNICADNLSGERPPPTPTTSLVLRCSARRLPLRLCNKAAWTCCSRSRSCATEATLTVSESAARTGAAERYWSAPPQRICEVRLRMRRAIPHHWCGLVSAGSGRRPRPALRLGPAGTRCALR